MRLNEFYMQYLNLIDFVMLCSYATEIINFSVRDFFSPPCALKCPKERPSPPENILKFNVPGGKCLSLGYLLRTWPPDICAVKTTLRFSREVKPLYG